MRFVDASLEATPPFSNRRFPFFSDAGLRWPLYKLTTQEHYESFDRDGSLWINTIYALADEKKLDRGVGDINEGSRCLTYMGPLCDVAHGTIPNCMNAYIYCAAEEITARILEVWKPAFVFRINDIEFYREITRQLVNCATSGALQPVLYGNWSGGEDYTRWVHDNYPRVNSIEEVCPPYVGFLKDRDLDYQMEVRAIWEPRPHSREHLADSSPDAEMFYSG